MESTHAVLWWPSIAARSTALLRRADVRQVSKAAPAIVRLPLSCLLLLLLCLLLWRQRLLLPLLLLLPWLPLRLLLLPLVLLLWLLWR